jgi:hypothetical protein
VSGFIKPLQMTRFWFAWTKPVNSTSRKHEHLCQPDRVSRKNMILNMNVTALVIYLYPHGALVLSAPLKGWRHVKVTDHHTKEDWAQVIKELVDEHFPEKKKIVLVMDNLNTHKLSSLYTAFKPEEARRIAERLEIHYTPKHGSWLDMAEIVVV